MDGNNAYLNTIFRQRESLSEKYMKKINWITSVQTRLYFKDFSFYQALYLSEEEEKAGRWGGREVLGCSNYNCHNCFSYFDTRKVKPVCNC